MHGIRAIVSMLRHFKSHCNYNSIRHEKSLNWEVIFGSIDGGAVRLGRKGKKQGVIMRRLALRET